MCLFKPLPIFTCPEMLDTQGLKTDVGIDTTMETALMTLKPNLIIRWQKEMHYLLYEVAFEEVKMNFFENMGDKKHFQLLE